MRPSMFMGGSGLPPATFVGAASQYMVSPALVSFADIPGLAVGDYLLMFVQTPAAANYGSLSQAGWTQDNYIWTPGYGYRTSVFHRQIETLTPPKLNSITGASLWMVAYRGASRASRKVISYDDDGNSSHVVPGFTRANDSVGVVCNIIDRDTDDTDFTPSAGWTRRILAEPNFRGAVADALPRGSYVDGASMTWTNLATGGPYAEVAQMYELRV